MNGNMFLQLYIVSQHCNNVEKHGYIEYICIVSQEHVYGLHLAVLQLIWSIFFRVTSLALGQSAPVPVK